MSQIDPLDKVKQIDLQECINEIRAMNDKEARVFLRSLLNIVGNFAIEGVEHRLKEKGLLR